MKYNTWRWLIYLDIFSLFFILFFCVFSFEQPYFLLRTFIFSYAFTKNMKTCISCIREWVKNYDRHFSIVYVSILTLWIIFSHKKNQPLFFKFVKLKLEKWIFFLNTSIFVCVCVCVWVNSVTFRSRYTNIFVDLNL